MRRAAPWVLAAALVAGCDGRPQGRHAAGAAPEEAIREAELFVQVTVPAEEVALGRAFPLEVERVWSRDLVPDPWDDAALRPLAVRLEQVTRREDAERVEETRRYRAYAFRRGAVTVPGVRVRAAPVGGGPGRVATAGPLELRVTPALGPDASDDAEVPGGLLRPPPRWSPWWTAAVAGLAVAVLAGAGLWWSRRRARAGPGTVPDPRAQALARLERLREVPAGGAEAARVFYAGVAAVVRDHLAARHGLPAPRMSTEQLLAAPAAARVLEPPERAVLAELLARCDRVKFAGHVPEAADRESTLAAARRFVARTHGEDPGGAAGAAEEGRAR